MAASYGESREEMLSRLKRHYDGYHFSERMTDVYNPFSLLNAFAQKAVRDYWFASGTPTYLIRLLSHSDENLDELTGKYYDPSQFVDYKADGSAQQRGAEGFCLNDSLRLFPGPPQ